MKPIIATVFAVWISLLAGAIEAHAGTNDSALSRQYTDAYAQCMTWSHHDRAAAVILKDVDDETLKAKYGDIYVAKPLVAVFECDTVRLPPFSEFVLSPTELRFALARNLVLNDLKRRSEDSFASIPPLPHRPTQSLEALVRLSGLSLSTRRDTLLEMQQADAILTWLAYYGECVVRRDPANTRAWLFSKDRSRDEAAIVQALVPSFSACLSDGKTLNFGRDILRGTLAIAYYRLAMAAPTPATTTR